MQENLPKLEIFIRKIFVLTKLENLRFQKKKRVFFHFVAIIKLNEATALIAKPCIWLTNNFYRFRRQKAHHMCFIVACFSIFATINSRYWPFKCFMHITCDHATHAACLHDITVLIACFTHTGKPRLIWFQFHQTLRTYLYDRVWDFYFYVNKDWPERPVILHFPGMTATVSGFSFRFQFKLWI